MKLTIFLIALYVGADLHERGYSSFGGAVILVALYEAILADWFVEVKERQSSISREIAQSIHEFQEIKSNNKNIYLAKLEVLWMKGLYILYGIIAAPFVLFHVLFGESAGLLIIITVAALYIQIFGLSCGSNRFFQVGKFITETRK